MAKLKTTYEIPVEREAVALDKLSRTIRGPRGGLVGRLINFPVGDGFDRYIVENLQPLILSRVVNGPTDCRIAADYLESVTLHEVRMMADFEDAMEDL